MTDLNIYVITHREYRMPKERVYCPLAVGAYGRKKAKDGASLSDACGDNISEKNPHYCELTGHYWIWKNTNSAYVGLVHYRRHFCGKKRFGKRWARVLTAREAEQLLSRSPVVLPKKHHYVIETNESHYAHAHHAEDLEQVREVIRELCPEYLPAYDARMNKRSGHRFNMFLMRRAEFDAYSRWLFAVLFALEARLDITSYSTYDQRVFGFVAERLLDVWLDHEYGAGARFPELPVLHMERRNLPAKGLRFLVRKWKGRKTDRLRKDDAR